MIRTRLFARLTILALTFAMASSSVGQTVQSLAEAKKLYVGEFHGGAAAERIRQSLIKHLRRSGKFALVGDPNDADAIVTGTGQIWIKGYLTTNWRAPATNRQAVYGGYLSAEVVTVAGRTLWSYLVTPGKLVWTSITDDLAGTLARKMAEASEPQSPSTQAHSQTQLAKTSLLGAGATFPAPLYQKWFQSFQQLNPAVKIDYHAVGSEKGVEQLAAGEVDFAASDVSSPDMGSPPAAGHFRRIATVLGAVVPIDNLPDVTEDLRFTPEVLAGIYLGKIRKWNDPEIRRWNKGANLPDTEIVAYHRADGSGTTYTLSDFLAKISPEWKRAVGVGTHLNWPSGAGAQGNEGVAAAVESTPNSMGYVELVYAIQHQLSFGLVRNSSGAFIRAGLDTLAEAANSTAIDFGLPASITNAPSKGAYPIATFTWLIFPETMTDPAKKSAFLDLLRWILTDGQNDCSALAYSPLPRDVASRELQSLNDLH